MNLWHSLEGQLELELLTADPAGALCAFSAVPLTRVQPESPLLLRFRIRRTDLPKAIALAQRRGEKLRIVRHLGLFWRMQAFFRRPVLLVGLAVLFCLVLFIPTRILFFRVEGNRAVPARKILAAAEESGLYFGVSRRGIRSEKIKNQLLSAIPELKWAGINTKGCVATVQVAEKQEPVPMEPDPGTAASIVANRDGVIFSLTATRGTALCAPGQAVSKGQVLISGYTDCGLCVLSQRAQGEVMAYTGRSFSVLMPENRLQKGAPAKIIRRWSLIFQKKRIKLWFGSGILGRECGRMCKEYPLTLPGGFVLPVSLVLEEYTAFPLTPERISPREAEEQLKTFSKDFLRQSMAAGTVQTAAETVSLSKGAYVLSGFYSCLESIGVARQEQIGDIHE